MAYQMTQMFQDLASYGILDSLLPFMLIFAIVFAILQKSKIFASQINPNPKNFNVIIALVMGLAVVIPHVMGIQPDVVPMINSALPQVTVVLVAIVMVLLIIGIWAPNISWYGGVQGWMVLIALGIVVYIFGNSAGLWTMPAFLYFFNDPETQSLIIIFLVFAIIIWFITKEDNAPGFDWKKSGQNLGNIFGLNGPPQP